MSFSTRILFAMFFIAFTLGGCKKAIEKKKENIIVAAMTSGRWRVASFTKDGSDITSSFTPYSFQYYENRTVDAINAGNVEKKGTWTEDIGSMKISAQFNGAVSPLDLINGDWKFEASDWTYVVASQTTTGGSKLMRLEKL